MIFAVDRKIYSIYHGHKKNTARRICRAVIPYQSFSLDALRTSKSGHRCLSELLLMKMNDQIARLSEQTGMSKAETDNLIRSFCADGYGKVCTANPHCHECPIKNRCRKE